MIKTKYIWPFLILLMSLSSCKIAKYLPAKSKIYGGSKVLMYYKENDKTELKEELLTQVELIIQPKENTKIGSYPYKVGVYYKLENSKTRFGKFLNNLKIIQGQKEKPVFFTENILKKNEVNIRDYLKTRGYFDAKVDAISTIKELTHSAKYFVKMGPRYTIDSLILQNDTSSNFHKDFTKSLNKIKFGPYFDLNEIKTQRQKIEASMREIGYYAFRPDYISIIADTLSGKKGMTVKIEEKKEIPEIAKKQYQINDIFVSIDERPLVSTDESSDFFRGLILDDKNQKYKPELFSDAIAFRPGTLYDSRLQAISSNRLVGLGNFKLVNISFNIVNRLDSTLIDSYYYLQTSKSKAFRAEANAISRSSGLAGSQFSINWSNINMFKGAEQFKLTARTNFEFQLGGKRTAEVYNNNYRVGLDAQMTLPRFWAPRIKIDPEISKVLPKTQIVFGWESFLKTGLYNLNSAKASLNYTWTRGRGVEHALKPFSLTILKSNNLSSVFLTEIFSNPKLLAILENQFVAGGSYNISVLPKSTPKGQYSYNGGIDFAGNTLRLFDAIRNKPAVKGKIFGEYFSQFIRLENEFRYRRDFSRKIALANRAFVGIGLPYGNSLQLPFPSQFYVGGNNSLRAFRARSVGPGTYKRTNTLAESFLGNNTGDIKLEFNTELRYKLNSLFSSALFLDAGNVWMTKDRNVYGKEALFSKNFIREMAVGTGLGFRFDFTFIIFRIDVGTPVFRPSENIGKRWVIDQFNPINKAWRKENVVWNVAIGLPF